MHLILNLNISYFYLIKFHDFANNNQDGMKHQMKNAIQAQQVMTLQITLLTMNFSPSFATPIFQHLPNGSTSFYNVT